MDSLRLVFDTSTIISALRSEAGASRRLISAALAQEFTLLVSVPLMIEYEAVMTRPEHLHRSRLSSQDVGRFLDTIADRAEPVTISFLWRPASLDPGDDMVLEAAVNGKADAVVTFNTRHFADLETHFGVKVISPGVALKSLEARA